MNDTIVVLPDVTASRLAETQRQLADERARRTVAEQQRDAAVEGLQTFSVRHVKALRHLDQVLGFAEQIVVLGSLDDRDAAQLPGAPTVETTCAFPSCKRIRMASQGWKGCLVHGPNAEAPAPGAVVWTKHLRLCDHGLLQSDCGKCTPMLPLEQAGATR